LLPRVPNALREGKKHSGKPSPSATLGEEPPGMPLTGKRSSPSAKNRTLGEAFPECHPSTRGRFDAIGAVWCVFFGKTSSPSATLGEEIPFLKPLPRVQHSGNVVWTSLGPLPRWVLGPTTRWAPGTTRLVPYGTCWREAQGPRWRSIRIGSYAYHVRCRGLLDVHD
jgi:hypothetical protein